jgi:transposase
MIRSKDHRFDLRIHLVRLAILKGIREATRRFRCSRKTVRKWLRRYQADGVSALSERSRAPKSCPHKTSPDQEREVLRQRARTPGFSAARLKREFGLFPSVGAIARILRQKGLTRKRKRKHQTKRDLRAIKAKYPPLRRFQIDVKYLNDLPHYWPYYQSKGFPRFQYTTRDIRTGATFLAFANEISVTYAELTARRLMTHLKAYGIDPAEVVVQTDRGSEFDGQAVHKNDRGFTYTIEQGFKAQHRLIPPHHPNANADVESFHSLEEPEFFDIESFKSPRDFWEKITTYQNYFNFARLNSYKWNLAPIDILRNAAPDISPRVLLLPPINLATLPLTPKGVGHYLPVEPVASFITRR